MCIRDSHIVLPIDVDKEKFEYVVDQFMLATARCTPIEPTYTFYSEKEDVYKRQRSRIFKPGLGTATIISLPIPTFIPAWVHMNKWLSACRNG